MTKKKEIHTDMKIFKYVCVCASLCVCIYIFIYTKKKMSQVMNLREDSGVTETLWRDKMKRDK